MKDLRPRLCHRKVPFGALYETIVFSLSRFYWDVTLLDNGRGYSFNHVLHTDGNSLLQEITYNCVWPVLLVRASQCHLTRCSEARGVENKKSAAPSLGRQKAFLSRPVLIFIWVPCLHRLYTRCIDLRFVKIHLVAVVAHIPMFLEEPVRNVVKGKSGL